MKRSLGRWLAMPALVLLLAACGTSGGVGGDEDEDGNGTGMPPQAEPLTQAEFMEFLTDFEADVSAAISDFTPSLALNLAFNAAGLYLPPGEVIGDLVRLPRGKWAPVVDDYGWPVDWEHVAALDGPGELEFTSPLEILNEATEMYEWHELDYAIDWQAGGAATTSVDLYGDRHEFPRATTATVSTGTETIVDGRVEVDPEVIVYECTDEYGTWSDEMLSVNSLLLNGTFGVAGELLLKAVDVGFEVDETAGTATSNGEIHLDMAAHTLSASWDASLSADSSLWTGYEDLLICGTTALAELNPVLDLHLVLGLDGTELELEVQAGLEDDANISVDLALQIDGAAALSISGVLLVEADEPLNDLVVEFSDETMSFTEFMESLAPLFGEDL